MTHNSFFKYLEQFIQKAKTADSKDSLLESAISEYEAKKGFLAMLDHELRNPLAAILSSIELLRLEKTSKVESALLFKIIEERTQFIKMILDELLDLSRIPQLVPPHIPLSPHAQLPKASRLKNQNNAKHFSKNARIILVVDDNEVAAKTLGRLLEMRGHTVVIAYKGQEALTMAKALHPHIIILDIGLPDMSGYEVIAALQKQKTYSPIFIALTGYGQTHDKQHAHKAGFHFHLTKPIGIKELEVALKKVTLPAKQRVI
jgi:CheY-like chemotaxis protein